MSSFSRKTNLMKIFLRVSLFHEKLILFCKTGNNNKIIETFLFTLNSLAVFRMRHKSKLSKTAFLSARLLRFFPWVESLPSREDFESHLIFWIVLIRMLVSVFICSCAFLIGIKRDEDFALFSKNISTLITILHSWECKVSL